MKKILLCFSFGMLLLSCDNKTNKPETTGNKDSEKTTVELPYTATYSSSFTSDVSDADLKTVLTSYKDWADGNMTGLSNAFGDTLEFDRWDGVYMKLPKAEIIKMWTTARDSLSSINIEMQGWHKMYATDKKQGFIVTWYKETDNYKTGKVDSASWHDINLMKDGKIVAYSQYKRPLKK